jgi:hypothetical protein
MTKQTLISLMLAAEDLGIGEAWEEPKPRDQRDEDEDDGSPWSFKERHEFTARSDYSGRGMFGKTTYAVTCGGWSTFCQVAARAAAMLAADGKPASDFIDSLGRLSWDSMGRDSIVIY